MRILAFLIAMWLPFGCLYVNSSIAATTLSIVEAACAEVSAQSCGDCMFDTAKLRATLQTLDTANRKGGLSIAVTRRVDICRLRGQTAMAAIHLVPKHPEISSEERDSLLRWIDVELPRLLSLYPQDVDVLKAVIDASGNSDRVRFLAYSRLADIEKHNSEAALWASYYAMRLGEVSWKAKMKSALLMTTDAQLYRSFVDILRDWVQVSGCDQKSQSVMTSMQASLSKIWQGVDADVTLMTPKMLRHAQNMSGYLDDICLKKRTLVE